MSAPSPLALGAIQVAHTQLGVQEDPPHVNKGKSVDMYLASVGLDPGFSWCAAFGYWCFEQSAEKLGIPTPLPKTAGVLNHWNITKGLKVTIPQTGDIGILDHGHGLGHEVLVQSVDILKGTYLTIEGNGNQNHSREGYEVCANTRNIADAKGFIRY